MPVTQVNANTSNERAIAFKRLNAHAAIASALARIGPERADAACALSWRILVIVAAARGARRGVPKAAQAKLARRKRAHPDLHQQYDEAQESAQIV